MKRFFILLSMAFAAFSCSQTHEEGHYTRGIGVYPGAQSEFFGPSLQVDGDYRNIALLRAAYHSSSFDYNLTAQLATDGIISEEEPYFMTVLTQDGPVAKRERERPFDDNFTDISVKGADDAFLEMDIHNGTISGDKVIFAGEVSCDQGKGLGYHIVFEVSSDGQTWKEIKSIKGAGLPGQAQQASEQRRQLNLEAVLPGDIGFSSIRVRLDCPAAENWSFSEINFMENGHEISILPMHHFCSAWMSEGNGSEWVYVDLGAAAEFDKIRLYWVNKAVEGSIETSNDAENWTRIADLPGGDGKVDEIAVRGAGRYVRVSADKSANGDRYILSEFEVYGKGGVVAKAQEQVPAKGNRMYLSGGNWKLRRASEVDADGAEISVSGFNANDWVTATVPATVASSYYNIGAIPDMNYDDDQFQISDSYFYSDFWYRDEFEFPTEFAGKELVLNFDGINWKADIYFNGEYVGHIDGAFMRGHFDVTKLAKTGRTNSVAVYIYKNDNPGIIKEQTRLSPDINGGVLGADNPTFHCSIGWDWIPTVRGRNIGIWNDVYVSAYDGGVSIDDVFVRTDLPLPDTKYADLGTTVSVTNYGDLPATAEIAVKCGDVDIKGSVSLEAGESKDVELPAARMYNPRLWWPAGYGEQYLYDLDATVIVNGAVSDTKSQKLGVREMSYDNSDGIMDIYVNGRRLICNGGNWGFPEVNLNFRGREYDIAVAYHADMNYTMIRDWVGQTADEEFYEACDRHGVMIWQDFWLANPLDGPDPDDDGMFLANAEDYLRRIRNHASIALYCGRNEGNPPEAIDKGLRELISKYHPEIQYIPHSASGPVSGNGPYRALPVEDYFTETRGIDRLHSERGMPNVMTCESMTKMLREKNRWPQTSVWGVHDYTLESHQACATFNEMISKALGEPSSLKDFTEKAQWINYNGFRAMYESRSWNRKGILIWMSHSCWPSMVWRSYDYYFEPDAAYFAIKKASAPIRIQYNPVNNNVEVVNNNAMDQNGLKAYAAILTYDGKVIYENEVGLDSEEDTTSPVMTLSFDQPELTDAYFIKLKLTQGDRLVADNFYWEGKEPGNYQLLNQPGKAKVSLKYTAERTADGYRLIAKVRNNGTVPALMLRLKVEGKQSGERILPCFYEDNYFSLLSGEEKLVSINFKDEDTRGEKPILTISGFNI